MSTSEFSQPPAAPSDSFSGSVDPQSIEGLFLAALQKTDPAERAAYLDEVCGGDDDRWRRIAALLRAYEDAGSFLESPAGGPRPGTQTDGGSRAAEPLALDFLTPSDKPGCLGTLGPYEVLNVIGRGGMGIVLRALDPKLNRVVAVKVLAPELAANPNARKRFLREAQAAAAVSHPHVVTIHAVEDGTSVPDARSVRDAAPLPYLVMECIVGQSLQEKLDRVGSLGVTEILRIAHQIACGLAAAHKQGLIHRDIKPANILLENGVERVKITDFGLARLVDDVAITRTGEVSGTPQYMSPEQAKGERVDHRSDLFSLGCVMYAMCTGHSPFRGDSLAHVIKRVTQDDPRPIEELNPDVPRWLVEIINRLLDKAPERRFQTSGELGDLLGAHLARQQHAAPGGVSHSGINAQHLPTVQPLREPWRGPTSEGAAAARTVRLIRVPWYWRLFGALLLVVGGVFVAGHLLSGLMVHLNPALATRLGKFQDHLVPALLFLFPAVIGWLLTRKWCSSQAMLGILFLGLGPLGLAIWLIRHEAWEAEAVDAETARAMDRREQSSYPEFDAALRAVVLTAVIATVLAIGISILLPVPDVVDFVGKVMVGAAFVALVLVIVRPFAVERLGMDGRRLLMLAGPSLWTLVCVPLLTIVGYDAVAVHSVREPYAGLLILIAAAWLIPVAAMLYFLRRNKRQESAPTAQPDVQRGGTRLSAKLPVPVALGSLAVIPLFLGLLWFVSQGTLRFTLPNVAEALALLMVIGMAVAGLLALADVILRRVIPERRGWGGGIQSLCDRPGKVLAWIAVAALVLIVAAPLLYLRLSREWRGDTVPITVNYDPEYPIHAIVDENRGYTWKSDRRPFPLELAPGVHTLTVRYTWQGLGGGELTKAVTVAADPSGEPLALDFTPDIDRDRRSRNWPALSTPMPAHEEPAPPPSDVSPAPAHAESEPARVGLASARPQPPSPPSVAWTSGRDHHFNVNQGGTHVRVLGQGLVVALRKKSLFDGTISNDETLISAFGDSYVFLDKGDYEWLFRDLEFGWEGDRRGHVTLLDPQQGTLVVQRNLADAIDPLDETRGTSRRWTSGTTARFRWNGGDYKLDEAQSEAVQRLAEAAITSRPDVPEGTILGFLNQLLGDSYDSGASFGPGPPGAQLRLHALKDLFSKDDATHPAWGTLIVPGEAPDTYRLAPINRGTLSIRQTEEIRSVAIHAEGETLEYMQPGEHVLSLKGGEYGVEFVPRHPDVAWFRPSFQGYEAFPAFRTVQVTAGDAVEFPLTSQLSDALPRQSWIGNAKDFPETQCYLLRWYGRGNLTEKTDKLPDPQGERYYVLNYYQGACVERLLHGLADGKPDVAASELQEIAAQHGFKSPEVAAGEEPPPAMESIFPGLPDGEWKDLLTAGDAEGTWRLKVPEQSIPEADTTR